MNVSLTIRSNTKSTKSPWQIRLNFKDFILVTRWVSDHKPTVPCFAIFTRQNTQHVFSLLSERILLDWFTQLSVYSSRVSRARQGLTANLCTAGTVTNKHGYGYYTFISSDRIEFIRQVEGRNYLKQIILIRI